LRIVVCYKWAPFPHSTAASGNSSDAYSQAKATFLEYDQAVLELAHQLANDTGAELVGLNVGSPETASSLVRQVALSHGLDRIVLVTDPGLDLAGVTETGLLQAEAIDQIGEVDLVLAGASSIGVAGWEVSAVVGGVLGWQVLSRVRHVERDGTSWRVERTLDGAYQSRLLKGPVVLCVVVDAGVPHRSSAPGLAQVGQSPVEALAADSGVMLPVMVAKAGPVAQATSA